MKKKQFCNEVSQLGSVLCLYPFVLTAMDLKIKTMRQWVMFPHALQYREKVAFHWPWAWSNKPHVVFWTLHSWCCCAINRCKEAQPAAHTSKGPAEVQLQTQDCGQSVGKIMWVSSDLSHWLSSQYSKWKINYFHLFFVKYSNWLTKNCELVISSCSTVMLY